MLGVHGFVRLFDLKFHEVGMFPSALLRQQFLKEEVVAIGVLFGIRRTGDYQMTFVAEMVGFLLEFYAENRVMDAVARVP